MSGKAKPDPILKAIADLQSVIDAASAEAKRAHETHAPRITESIKVGDLKGMEAAMNEYQADFDAAIATVKGSPTAKRASAAGKLSGEARRKKGEHPELEKQYRALRAEGLDHSKAARKLAVRGDWFFKSKSQFNRIMKRLKNSCA